MLVRLPVLYTISKKETVYISIAAEIQKMLKNCKFMLTGCFSNECFIMVPQRLSNKLVKI